MISDQDIEDFRQDAELLVLQGHCKHEDLKGFKADIVINKRMFTMRQFENTQRMLKEYNRYLLNLVSYENEELIFNVCKYVDYLPKGQREAIINFLKYGNNAVVASKTGEQYNT